MSSLNYEELRKKNIEDNKRILAEIGLVNPFKTLPRVTFKKSGLKRKADFDHQRPHKRPLLEQNIDHSSYGSLLGARRRSARLQGSGTPTEDELKKEVEQWMEEEDTPKKVPPNRPNFYGAIEGVEVGTVWLTRMECCRDGIHRPTVAGIHGGAEGAYSIALSGGYDDNIDLGDCFTYTGEGGRDLKGTANNPKNLRTAPQSKDQTLTRGNLALSKNVETGYPVRVIRGYKLDSVFAPEEGYRYDGLYSVQKAWYTTGVSGFKVWKFALKRCENQAPPAWTFAEGSEKDKAELTNNNENRPNLNEMSDVLDKDVCKENNENGGVATSVKEEEPNSSENDRTRASDELEPNTVESVKEKFEEPLEKKFDEPSEDKLKEPAEDSSDGNLEEPIEELEDVAEESSEVKSEEPSEEN